MHVLFGPLYPKGSPLPDELDPYAFATLCWYVCIGDKLNSPRVKSEFLSKMIKSLRDMCEAYCYAPRHSRIQAMENIKSILVMLEEYLDACGVPLD